MNFIFAKPKKLTVKQFSGAAKAKARNASAPIRKLKEKLGLKK